MPPPPAPDRCPRCGQTFACGVAGAGPCACTTVRLEPELLARLRQRFDTCLCLRCLAELAEGQPLERPPAVLGDGPR